MRPQRNAGENNMPWGVPLAAPRSFNEAPAKCRGKRRSTRSARRRRTSFNEAPAKCRGKPDA